ncbi:hypothetical protein HRK28_17175 [Rathayibacter sp. VKM Ac-2835]|uniref:hypothetical protein n=1 Tax=Rathayibacter sp. VKM Ac-2835 TaxID=2739043 RepID=UPI001565DC8F|nr:hypothetical protein [Rathayibacter sp. VKM Ac-2835]NRG42648.1 hypothetical protein [Rathayibacter sp. VKM Ac-2835]
MRGRRLILPGACLLGLMMVGCAPAETELPLVENSPVPAPEGAVYRSFYRGGVEGFATSPARWLDDEAGLEVTIIGSGNCPLVPVALEVIASDHLRITTQRWVGKSSLCQDDAVLWTYVVDPPEGLDSAVPVCVDVAGERSTSIETMEPRRA